MNEPPELGEKIQLPNEIKEAGQNNNLVLFIGAGISKLLDLPLWKEFASEVLEDLRKKDCLDYSDIDQLTRYLNPKQILSIADSISEAKEVKLELEKHFKENTELTNIYEAINSIACVYVTTNYDGLLGHENLPEADKRVYGRESIRPELLSKQGTAIHLHGYKGDPETMVVTTKDYLEHYDAENIQNFLKQLFQKKTVVFLGYSLEETEILEHIFRRGKTRKIEELKHVELKHFIVTGFFRSQSRLYEKLYMYYRETFGVKLLGFTRDREDHKGIESIIKDWAYRIKDERIEHEEIEFIEEVLGDG